ncbi:MAG: hypothetical protein RIS70_2273, partial [Planctomycetota bacterium]
MIRRPRSSQNCRFVRASGLPRRITPQGLLCLPRFLDFCMRNWQGFSIAAVLAITGSVAAQPASPPGNPRTPPAGRPQTNPAAKGEAREKANSRDRGNARDPADAAVNALWDAPVSFQWKTRALRDGLVRLAESQRVGILIDRRVDPETSVSFGASDVPLEEALNYLAQEIKLGACRVGPAGYVGPEPVAKRLATIASMRREECAKLPGKLRTKAAAKKPLVWEELSTPRELVKQLAEELSLTVPDLESAIPHDLWATGSFPEMQWSDRITLVLAGFDLTFQIDGESNALQLIPMPTEVSVSRGLAVKGDGRKMAEKLTQQFPQLDIKFREGKIWATGTVEDIAKVERVVQGRPTTRTVVQAPDEVYDLRVQAELFEKVARGIAKQKSLEVVIDPDVPPEKLQTRISLDLKDATLDKLFSTICEQAQL